jgi:hypothetical protein
VVSSVVRLTGPENRGSGKDKGHSRAVSIIPAGLREGISVSSDPEWGKVEKEANFFKSTRAKNTLHPPSIW